jgi:CheY-like chemotaxis protein
MSAADDGPPSILVVDDDDAMRAALAMVLGREGFRVLTAAHGRSALEQLRTGPRPRLILLDLMMPVMDGFQFRDEQRRDPLLADIPVIVVSGGGDVRRRAAALEAADYIEKPVDPAALLEAIRRHC